MLVYDKIGKRHDEYDVVEHNKEGNHILNSQHQHRHSSPDFLQECAPMKQSSSISKYQPDKQQILLVIDLALLLRIVILYEFVEVEYQYYHVYEVKPVDPILEEFAWSPGTHLHQE